MSFMHPREIALECGALTYIGVACKHCKNKERYSKNGDCVQCRRGKERAKKAKEPVKDRDQEQRDMKARLALVRAEQTAKQRRAMGL